MSRPRFDEMPAWQSCPDCSGGPTPGARALLAYWLEQHEPTATSLGIYACRPVRGSSSMSVHACGRAVDCGVPVTDAGHAAMWTFLSDLAPHAARLGIQYVIFDRTHWSARRDPDGEPYRGTHPHRDHAHVELTPAAASRLTLATLREVAGDRRQEGPTPPPDTPPPPPEGGLRGVPVPRRLTRQGDRSASVRIDQGLLMAHGRGPSGLTRRSGLPDGIFGPATDELVRDFQGAQSIGVDGIVGEVTRTRLLSALHGRGSFVRRDHEGAAVGRVQGLLLAHGHGPDGLVARTGRPDRIFGPATEDAVRDLQRSRGFTVDGIVGPETYRGLLYV